MRRSVAASAFDVTDVPRNARLRLRVLLVRMWRLNALLRRNFPVAVFLNRFAAPRGGFNFGICQCPVSSFQLPAMSFQSEDWQLVTGNWKRLFPYCSVSRASASFRPGGFLPTRCDR